MNPFTFLNPTTMKNFRAPIHHNVLPAAGAGLSSSTCCEFGAAPATGGSASVRRYVQKATFLALVLGGAFLASPASAQEPQPVVVKKVNDTTFRVRVQNPTQQVSQVRVVSLVTGNTLFYERYNAPEYGHDLNFRNLQTGQYVLLLQTGESRYRYTVQVQRQPQLSVALRTFTVKTRFPKLSPASAAL